MTRHIQLDGANRPGSPAARKGRRSAIRATGLAVLISAAMVGACGEAESPLGPGAPAVSPPALSLVGGSVYEIVDLGTLGRTPSSAVAINDAGQVVGTSSTSTFQTHAFLWQDDLITDLGTLGGTMSSATAVNDAGQVVGRSTLAAGSALEAHAFVWQGGVMTDLGTLGVFTSTDPDAIAASSPSAINEAGQVVGLSSTGAFQFFQAHAFIWQNGVMADLGTLGTAASSHAVAINEAGQVVVQRGGTAFLWQDGVSTELETPDGTRGFGAAINGAGQVVGSRHTTAVQRRATLWQDGTMTDLGTLGGGHSAAVAINENGQVVGWSTTAEGERRAFLWQDGVMIDLGAMDGTFSSAVAINDAGQVVGEFRPAGSFSRRAFLWQDGVMTDLGTLGGTHSLASAINGAGEVVGWSYTAEGHQHAVLWRPASSPDAALAALKGSVSTLVSTGALDAGHGIALTAKLDAALDQVDAERHRPAVQQLEAFVQHVQALVRAGRLAAEPGASLVTAARSIIELLSSST